VAILAATIKTTGNLCMVFRLLSMCVGVMGFPLDGNRYQMESSEDVVSIESRRLCATAYLLAVPDVGHCQQVGSGTPELRLFPNGASLA